MKFILSLMLVAALVGAATPAMAGATRSLNSFGHHKAWPAWGKWWSHHKMGPSPAGDVPAPEGDTGVCDATENIVEIAAGNPDFSTLVAAVQAAGFVEALSAEGPLDVFAPTNQAFADLLAALGITAEELLADTELLAQVLSYHVVVDGASCDTPLSGVVTTLQGATLDVSGSTVTDAAGQVINILATVPASNGQIFVIDGVLLPGGNEPVPEPPTAEAPAPEGDTGVCDATENIVEIAAGNPDFSTLVAAVQAAGFVEALSAEGPLDVFAPTNQAFADLLAALGITAEELLADTELLAQVLSYHVVVDGASCDTPLSGVVTTLQGATLDVSGSTVTDAAGQVINILAAVPASNGQIFVIDGVLLPQAPGGDEPVPEPPTAEAPAPEGDTGVCDATENIVEIAAGNPDFSTLVAAVQAAGFVEALSAEGPLDVFAPTNQAFADLLAALGITAEELLADTELLAQVLSYHVVVDGASCDTPLSGVVTTLQGATIDVSGSTVTDGSGQEINILDTVPASNGQIFVIDGVLLPQLTVSPSSE
ncbi:hypothetical protein M9435_004876 [Picochlorum sp. BPE23]|nr:hypothetical protein M9435_004876 [Picochlorum sp. BPE23]